MELQLIENKTYEIRGQRIMLDFDLAEMYETETRILKQAVRRNIERFPDDFMFQFSKKEWKQVITICDNLPETIKFSTATPFAFTKQGVAKLSSVLNSPKDLKENIATLEKQMNINFKDINQALHYLLNKDKQQSQQDQRKQIGFNK